MSDIRLNFLTMSDFRHPNLLLTIFLSMQEKHEMNTNTNMDISMNMNIIERKILNIGYRIVQYWASPISKYT
jgi:hypothetical protein